MMLETILSNCNERYKLFEHKQCEGCSYGEYCPHDCEKCLDYIHTPKHAPNGAPSRKYDCVHMADFYTCKYSCRYTSEIMYALEKCNKLHNARKIKILSFGCGPCTELFAIEALRKENTLTYDSIEYRGVDYSKEVWNLVHRDVLGFQNQNCEIKFFYKDICDLIHTIAAGNWTPNLIIFQYVFSDMQKHTGSLAINDFINTFAEYYNSKVQPGTYVILNDVNLGCNYGGGREYFDKLKRKLVDSVCRKGRFCNDNATNFYYPRGYPYGDDSDGEFPKNENRFNLELWRKYSPFDTCASAQMIIERR